MPDYAELLNFLMQPFLDSPETLSIDCELSQNSQRVWIRIAFDDTDKGKVFGRGGRNIQAIRTVVAAAAKIARQSVYLDIYGSNTSSSSSRDNIPSSEEVEKRLPPPHSIERRRSTPRPIAKPRLR
ncbi:MAG: KH domain-containing protein [Mastigocoleus sp.]